jgi:diguanylate cyclase (GGDEF)-like protein
MNESSPHLHRTDLLTGCQNLLSFLDRLVRDFDQRQREAYSLVVLDVNHFKRLNDTVGHEQGDAALRWVGIVLAEEAPAPSYRTGGDEFVVALVEGAFAAHVQIAERLFERLNREAGRVGLASPALTVAVVQYQGGHADSPADVMGHIEAAIAESKQAPGRPLRVFSPPELPPRPNARGLLDTLIRRMVDLGALLDETQTLALSDPLTALPNVRAAARELDAALTQAQSTEQPLAVLLIDGDNLRRYNEVGGYAAGDKMIQDLSAALRHQLRPGDFIARWRVGDEFLVLLPNTTLPAALMVGERLCRAVREASQNWRLPISISIGVAARPHHGLTDSELLARAEAAKDEAKAQGKDRVVSAQRHQLIL